MPCSPGNLDYMKTNGTVVYIKTGVDDILARVKDTGARPVMHRLGRGKTPREAVRALLDRRERYYDGAHVVVENFGGGDIREIACRIERSLRGDENGND